LLKAGEIRGNISFYPSVQLQEMKELSQAPNACFFANCGVWGLAGIKRQYCMNNIQTQIIEFDNSKHRKQVVDLWQTVFSYEASHNSPEVVIDKKLQNNDDLFFVIQNDQKVIGTVMAGYDGHRGWIYSIAVHPEYQKQGIGSDLLSFIHGQLEELGCLKINLQIMEGNEAVQKFYLANGYSVEKRVSMGKKLY